MKKLGSVLLIALFVLFSITSCNREGGETTTEYIPTINTEVTTQAPETDAETTAEETTAPTGIDTNSIIQITTNPETTAAPQTEAATEPITEPEVFITIVLSSSKPS